MGASNHTRVVPLYHEQTSYETRDRIDPYTRQRIMGPEIPGSRKTVRTDFTPQEAWNRVSDEEGWENGHSYSGDFGSKHDMVIVGRAPNAEKDVVAAAGQLAQSINYAEYDNSNPFKNLTDTDRAAIAAFGEKALRAAAKAFNDKWGPAAALVGKDHVWFGGSCPS